MKRSRLALQIIERAIFLGVLAGVVLGAIYGALLPWYDPLAALFAGHLTVLNLLDLPGLILIMLFYGIIWAAIGSCIGMCFGLAFGLVNGLIISLFTLYMVAVQRPSTLYQYCVQLISGITTLLGALAIIYLLSGGLNERSEWGLIGIPAISTLPAACWASRRLVQWLATQPQGSSLSQ